MNDTSQNKSSMEPYVNHFLPQINIEELISVTFADTSAPANIPNLEPESAGIE